MNSVNINNSASKLDILFANIEGFNNAAKRSEFFTHIEKQNPAVVCLSDTRLNEEMYSRIKNEQQFHCIYSKVDNAARGVCILIRKNTPIRTINTQCDELGNWVCAEIEHDSHRINLHCIYGPNTDTPTFFEKIFEYISNSNTTDNIIVGDFNVTLDTQLDNLNYIHEQNRNARKRLNELMDEYGFCDAYRALNGRKKNYTWFNRGGVQRARLDMAIVSNSIRPFLTEYTSLPFYKSDHRPQIVSIDYTVFKRGKGYWKLNNSLLHDLDFIKTVKESINCTCSIYYDSPEHNNFLNEAGEAELERFRALTPEVLQSLPFNIDPSTLLDMMLNDIKNAAIAFSVNKARRENEEEKRLLKDAMKYQNMKSLGLQTDNLDVLIETTERRYQAYIEEKNEKRVFRNKVMAVEENEKPTAYFCSLEKNMSAKKYISRLRVQRNGVERVITDQNAIANECRNFYLKLYENRDNQNLVGNLDFFKVNENVIAPKLSDEEAFSAEGELTEGEILRTLKNSKSNTAPGLTGFTYEFYKIFWRDLKTFIVDAANHSFREMKLPESQRVGVISLLPKGDKPMDLLKNLRPVTLTDSLYKLISGSVAFRINELLPGIINEQQCGFVKGRYIGECIRTTFDVFEWAKKHNKTGLLLLIDFEKAFDSISFNFIIKSLKYFGFKENLIQWVKTILYNFKATINLAGNLTTFFDVLRGARQGDPIASPLFILAIEILCIRLRNSNEIHSFNMNGLEILLSLFADDCSIFLEYNSTDLRNTISILNDFFLISGLKIQLEKTQCVVFGHIPNISLRLCEEINLKWEQHFTLLGVDFHPSLENVQENLDKKMKDIDNVINNWKHRFLTPLGRCTVAKTLILSKLSHLAAVLPTLNTKFILRLESKIYDFIWKGPDKVKREDAKKEFSQGGLKMPDVYASWQSFKMAWFRRLLKTNAAWGKLFDHNLQEIFPNIDRNYISAFGTSQLISLSKNFPSNFWTECFLVLKKVLLLYIQKYPDRVIGCQIWNSHVFVRNKLLCGVGTFRSMFNKISFPSDIITQSNGMARFLTFDECDAQWGEINENEYISLKVVISQSLARHRTRLGSISIIRPTIPTTLECIMLSEKGCGKWSKLLKQEGSNCTVVKTERKWEASLGNNQGVFFWDQCYRNVKDLFFDNRLKLFYYMVIRGTLKTNRIVHHHVRTRTANCTFCNSEIETILHLFWDCPVTTAFLNVVSIPIRAIFNDFILNCTRKEFIFGRRDESICSEFNFIATHIKYFIWISRCNKKVPNYTAFQNWFTNEIRIKKKCYEGTNKLLFLNGATL